MDEKQKNWSISGFVYPQDLRVPIRDPDSQFYLPKSVYPKDTFPMYPAGGAYVMSNNLGRERHKGISQKKFYVT